MATVEVPGEPTIEVPVEAKPGHRHLLTVRSRPAVPADLVLIPGGAFAMGDATGDGYEWERPVHRVEVSSFYLDRFPVTLALWEEIRRWAEVVKTSGAKLD